MARTLLLTGSVIVALVTSLSSSAFCDEELRERLKDTNGVQTDWWVYNNIPAAMEEARKQNKPLFVTFRCVPCKDCAAFDADVANGNERVREFAKQKFVSVRQVEMKGVDLSLFQFDYDLNWAGIFINADGVVYARYGTQSAEGSDAYNSIDGLLATMHRVLELHANYPANKAELAGKRGMPRTVSSALELPGLRNPAKYAQETTRGNCIHCHNIHDAEHQHALDRGIYSPELLLKYPLPDNIGLKIDRKNGVRIAQIFTGSAAEQAGLKAGEDIVRMNGQKMTSVADMQWVLHHLPNTKTAVDIEGSETGVHKLHVAAGWKQHDWSWRGSMWNAPPRLQVWLPELNADAIRKLQLPEVDSALEVRWINQEGAGGRRAFADGLREGDIVVALGGKPFHLNSRQFNAFIKVNYKVDDTLPLTVLRDGKRLELKIRLVE